MAKSSDEPDVATQIMARMVRMPPKQHKDMKLGSKSKTNASENAIPPKKRGRPKKID
jgi:hypothetical protein